jgi:hypothetical protein
MRFAHDAAVVVLLLVLRLVVLALPGAGAAGGDGGGGDGVDGGDDRSGQRDKTNNGIASIPARTGPRVRWSVAGDHDPIGGLHDPPGHRRIARPGSSRSAGGAGRTR